jgi:hypothetical protein
MTVFLELASIVTRLATRTAATTADVKIKDIIKSIMNQCLLNQLAGFAEPLV